MNRCKIIILFLIILQQFVWAQFTTEVNGAGTTAASFLEIGVGARAMAMGGAYTAIADGPTALFYTLPVLYQRMI